MTDTTQAHELPTPSNQVPTPSIEVPMPPNRLRGVRLGPILVFGAAALVVGCGQGGDAGSADDAFDVILRGGLVHDGSGAAPRVTDIGVRDGRIAEVGDLSAAGAAEELDVTGLHVAPGFMDAHSHAGGGLASEGLSHSRPLLAQGITTVFVNPDGGGPVDMAAQRDALLEHGLGVNAAQFVPHGSVRRSVLGMADREPTGEEMEEMRVIVREGMDEGAWGLSSGTFYSPGSYSENSELVELARVTARYGGVYSSHIRDESNYTIGVVAAVDEVIEVGREAGVTAVVTHIKALGPPVWGESATIIQHIQDARDAGVRVYADQYPYIASATGLSAALLPRWAQAGGQDSLVVRLADAGTRSRIKSEMVENLARRGGADRIQFRRYTEDEALEGRLLSDVAEERGVDPIDLAMEFFETGSPSIVSFNMSEDDVRAFMIQPWTMTASDGDLVPWNVGVPHPRSYGTFPRKLGVYSRDEGIVPLELAIHSMTGLVAEVFGISDRGRIGPGAVADITVFDLTTINDPAIFTDPHQLGEGVVHVFVDGVAAWKDGEATGALPGTVLRRPTPAG